MSRGEIDPEDIDRGYINQGGLGRIPFEFVSMSATRGHCSKRFVKHIAESTFVYFFCSIELLVCGIIYQQGPNTSAAYQLLKVL